MGIIEISILHHVGIVLFFIWLLSSYNCCHPIVYFISLIYLYLVHERYVKKLRKNVQFEERRRSNSRRVLSDSETVRWLNHTIERMWPVCMEQIISQKILLPLVPWFLQKYKPWTVKDALVQSFYMGRSPPMFTEMRVLRQSDDDHLVLELGMNFRTANDMSAVLDVKLRKRLGLGMSAKLHLTGIHVEGKVLIGVKFLPRWPFLGRLRVCFVEPPYFQMTIKPLFAHGLDVTEVPGIAGWMDKLLGAAFEETLIEPNMLVVDVEKLVSPESESWFSVDAKEPIAYALVEVIEAAEIKPSDLNGLADPYVKGQLGPYGFRTKTQRKTLSPKWQEEFKVPISTWESPNLLNLEVRDKDRFVDDTLGDSSISITDLRDGQRHDMWLSLQNIKTGRLHLAITVVEVNGKGADQPCGEEALNDESKRKSFVDDTSKRGSFSSTSEKSPTVADIFEPIDVEGQRETGIWVYRPGSEVPQLWEPRKGKSRLLESQIQGETGDPLASKSPVSGSYSNDDSSTDESVEGNKTRSRNPFKRGLQKIGSVFRRSPREDKSVTFEEPVPSPHDNLKALNAKERGVKLILDDNISLSSPVNNQKVEERDSTEESGPEAKSIFKQAGESARDMKHALSWKGSQKSEGLSESNASVISDSSDEGSLTSPAHNPRVEANSIVCNPISGRGSESFKSKERTIQPGPNDPVLNTLDPVDKVSIEGLHTKGEDQLDGAEEKHIALPSPNNHTVNVVDPMYEVIVEGLERTGENPSDSSKVNDDGFTDGSSTKPSEGH